MIESKKCFKCLTFKPLNEFYKHSEMADGHVNKCKECNKNDVNQHRKNNLERIREYDRKRGKLPHRLQLATEVTRAWRAEDIQKIIGINGDSRDGNRRKSRPDRGPCIATIDRPP